jgi:aspartate/methionine/tyrosine aminotransferase
VLSPERRAAALDWARTTGGLILEDDYDGEFRYDRKPVGALQGLDPDHVVYFGTASKSLAPALRVGWIVVPGHFRAEVAAAKGPVETTGVLDQLTLTEFITSGAFDRHVRTRRTAYRRRRDQLIEAPGFRPYCGCRRAPSRRFWPRRPAAVCASARSPSSGTSRRPLTRATPLSSTTRRCRTVPG